MTTPNKYHLQGTILWGSEEEKETVEAYAASRGIATGAFIRGVVLGAIGKQSVDALLAHYERQYAKPLRARAGVNLYRYFPSLSPFSKLHRVHGPWHLTKDAITGPWYLWHEDNPDVRKPLSMKVEDAMAEAYDIIAGADDG